MGIDNKEDIKRIKSKISAFKTLRKQKQEAKKRKKKSFSEKVDKAKKLSSETLTNLKNSTKKKTDSLFEDLIELFIQTNEGIDEKIKEQKEKFKKNKTKKNKPEKLKKPNSKYSGQTQNIVNTIKNSNSFKKLGSIFFTSVENTKTKISQLLIEDIIFTIGCSEEQSYSNISNTSTPLYINLKTIDLFKILKNSPDDKYGKLNYESTETQNGVIPYSMNREIYKRLSSPQSFSQEYQQSFISSSGQELFDMQYVDNYTNQLGNTFYGDFLKITLKDQLNNRNNITDFLNDYYSSIDVFTLSGLMNTIFGQIFGSINVGIDSSQEELEEFNKFLKILKRLMGVCVDPNKKIDITGSAKLSEQDLIDDSFFELTNIERQEIEDTVNRKLNNLITFEDCETIDLPNNPQATAQIIDEIITEKKATAKVNLFFNGIEDLVSDPNWQNSLIPKLNINLSVNIDVIKNLPMLLIKTILSPKVMLGFMIMVKALIGDALDFEDLTGFLKKYKKFFVKFSSNVISIFLEELTKEIKKNISKLVESILEDIKKEIVNKQTKMYIGIIQALLIVGKGVLDYRECKSVIDDILKLLNLIV